MRLVTALCASWILAAAVTAQEKGEAASGGIAWQADLQAANEFATASGRPLALYFTFDT